jgi:GTPase SAR1 family protein
MSGQRVDVKVVMLGKEYVGKTSLVERYVHDRFLVGPYQNVSASGPGTVGGGSLHPRPDLFLLVADHRGCLRGQSDVRRRPDSDFGYLGESFGNMILGKPVPEALRPTSY